MNTYITNQQPMYQHAPLSPQDSSPSKHAVELVTLMNPVSDNTGMQQPVHQTQPQSQPQPHYGGFPMTRRNYTYTANVATQKTPPSAVHPHTMPPMHVPYAYNTPQLRATASGAASPMLMIRRESFQPLSNGTSPVYGHQWPGQLGQGLGGSTSPEMHGFRGVAFDKAHAHRHSIALASLDHQHQLSYSQGTAPAQGEVAAPVAPAALPNADIPLVAVQPHRASMPVIKTEITDEDMSLPATPEDVSLDETCPARDNSALHNVGERYNARGELIGRSGKVLRDTKRAAQNRSAQKAFRVRREKYIKGLEVKGRQFDVVVRENTELKRRIGQLESRVQELQHTNDEMQRSNDEMQRNNADMQQRYIDAEQRLHGEIDNNQLLQNNNQALQNNNQTLERRYSAERSNNQALQNNNQALQNNNQALQSRHINHLSQIEEAIHNKVNQYSDLNVEFEDLMRLLHNAE